MQRRDFLAAALAASAVTAFAQGGGAYPAGPSAWWCPSRPAAAPTPPSRMIAEKLTSLLGWTVVIDNKPGAGGNIGLDAVAKARPDGYTIGMGQAANLAINPSLYAKMPFDPLKDLTPIVSVAEQPVVLVVRQDSPFKTLADFVQAAKATPRQGSASRRPATAPWATSRASCSSGVPASRCCRCRTRARARR
jgi:tripartite-type tricarboxylate transporter receptor subunit TctC